MNDLRDLTLALKSHLPLVCIETQEEPRLLALLEQACNLETFPVCTWSLAQGLRRIGRDASLRESSEFDAEATRELAGALRHNSLKDSFGIFIFLDPQPFLEDPMVLRLIKENAQGSMGGRRKLVLVGNRIQLPEDLRRMSAVFTLPLATPERVRKIFKEELDEAREKLAGTRIGGQTEAANMLVQHLAGLCEADVRRLLREALYDDCSISLDDVDRVLSYKQKNFAGGGVLTLELDCGSFANVGGQKHLKRWLERRRGIFLQESKQAGLDPPKGLLLLGVQGAGKSMAAKAIAGSWRVPLLRLDFGALFSKWSGETERNLRDSLKAAEAMAPSVLWIDEIEKGVAPASGESDGGISRRILGTLLTWMTERKSRVFLAATANDISSLPAELLRKGRFDEIFFVDLPDAEVRAEIFAIQLKRRQQDEKSFDLAVLAKQSEGFSGAEIEQAVVSALYESVAVGKPLSTALISEELQRTRPLSVVMAEKVDALRAWAASRTVPAN